MREVSFEFEEVPGTTFYEINITPISKTTNLGHIDTPITIKSKEPMYLGKLYPGLYKLRVRAIDKRHAHSEWSESMDIIVPIPESVKILPIDKAIVSNASTDENQKIQFSWKSIEGVTEYQLTISEKNKTIVRTTSDTTYVEKLPVGASYTWNVIGLIDSKPAANPSEGGKLWTFNLMGPKLSQPLIKEIDLDSNPKIEWQNDKQTTSTLLNLEKLNAKTNAWEPFKKNTKLEESSFEFDKLWGGGFFRISLKAQAENYKSSELASREFSFGLAKDLTSVDLIKGRLFPKKSAIELAIDLTGSDIEFEDIFTGSKQNTHLDFTTLKIKYQKFKLDSNWGFEVQVGEKVFKNKNQSTLLNNLNFSADYRKRLKSRWQILTAFGLDYSEKQSNKGISSSTGLSIPILSENGFAWRLEALRSINSKWNFRPQLKIVSTLGGQTDFYATIKPSISYEIIIAADYFYQEKYKIFGGLISRAIRSNFEALGYKYTSSQDENGATIGFAREF